MTDFNFEECITSYLDHNRGSRTEDEIIDHVSFVAYWFDCTKGRMPEMDKTGYRGFYKDKIGDAISHLLAHKIIVGDLVIPRSYKDNYTYRLMPILSAMDKWIIDVHLLGLSNVVRGYEDADFIQGHIKNYLKMRQVVPSWVQAEVSYKDVQSALKAFNAEREKPNKK